MHNTAHQPVLRVTAAIMAHRGKVLIAQRRASSRHALKWEFPGGKIEPHETPQACLQRELKEEFGIDVDVGEDLGASLYTDDHVTIELIAFRAHWRSGTFTLHAHHAVAWVEPKDLTPHDFTPADRPFVERLRSGQIRVAGPLKEQTKHQKTPRAG